MRTHFYDSVWWLNKHSLGSSWFSTDTGLILLINGCNTPQKKDNAMDAPHHIEHEMRRNCTFQKRCIWLSSPLPFLIWICASAWFFPLPHQFPFFIALSHSLCPGNQLQLYNSGGWNACLPIVYRLNQLLVYNLTAWLYPHHVICSQRDFHISH